MGSRGAVAEAVFAAFAEARWPKPKDDDAADAQGDDDESLLVDGGEPCCVIRPLRGAGDGLLKNGVV